MKILLPVHIMFMESNLILDRQSQPAYMDTTVSLALGYTVYTLDALLYTVYTMLSDIVCIRRLFDIHFIHRHEDTGQTEVRL